MQTFRIRFHVFTNGVRGNVMAQDITAYSPTEALAQLSAMYGRVEVVTWAPVVK